MALSDITSRQAVRSATTEFDRLGRDDFLSRHGFGKARKYFLELDGHLYDSKAIVGVAHGYQFPGEGPLKSAEFSGGDATVRQKLEELRFTVRVIKDRRRQTSHPA
jgi:putative restriction endonuclease